MQVSSHTFTQAYQNPFIHTSIANFCGKMVCLIDQVNFMMNEKVQRIAFIAISIFSIAALAYWIFKNSSVTATLTSEIECAKQDILDRCNFDDSNLVDAEAAKLFLTINHGGNVFSKTVILPQDVNKQEILKHFDILFQDIQEDIVFNPFSKMKVKIGILAKGKDYKDQPTFSYKLNADSTALHGQTFNRGIVCSTKILASDNVQNNFCDLMEISQAPQIDSHGNFI